MEVLRVDNLAIRARWVIPVDGEPISDGTIVVRNGRIVELGKSSRFSSDLDLGDVVVLPSLVNAHTHLEFSRIERPIGEKRMPFPEWIRRVIAWRRGQIESGSPASEFDLAAAISAGIRESNEAGTIVFGEIATSAAPLDVWNRGPNAGVIFYELIGLARSRVRSAFEKAIDLMRSHAAARLSLDAGLSPHAPYTVHPELLHLVTELSRKERFPVAMHLAESEPELELLRSGSGPFVELLVELNAWDPDAIHRGTSPMEYLKRLAEAHRALIIHGNYLSQDEIRFVGERHERMSVVYCPRTHDYFGHRDYPLRQMLDAGVRVAIGTDSRASNPTLDIFEEIRFAASRHPEIPPDGWLEMVTRSAAEALGVGSDYGSLLPGKRAAMVALELGSLKRDELWDWLWDERVRLNRLVVPA